MTPEQKEALEAAVYAAAKLSVKRVLDRIADAVSPWCGGDRDQLMALHALYNQTASLEGLCSRFGLAPLTGIWEETP